MKIANPTLYSILIISLLSSIFAIGFIMIFGQVDTGQDAVGGTSTSGTGQDVTGRIYMNVIIKKTGGYAGLSDVTSIDTQDETKFTQSEAQNIERIVQSIGFFELPSVIPSEDIGADLFRYEITVSDGERQHTVTFDEGDSPKTFPLRKLLKALNIQ